MVKLPKSLKNMGASDTYFRYKKVDNSKLLTPCFYQCEKVDKIGVKKYK